MRFLSPVVHGAIDFIIVPVFLFAPSYIGFEGAPRTASYVLGLVWLALSILTRFPVSIARALPFRLHALLEAVLAPVVALMPWLLGYGDVPAVRNFFLVMGVALAVLVLVTNLRTNALARRERVHQDRRYA
jgi:hypothetical protein